MSDFEGGHWYDKTGVLVAEVPRAKGDGFRPTTLRDARKLDLRPSVTTILGVLDKPGLRNWRIMRAIGIALAMPNPDLRSVEEVMAETDLYVEFAAAQGTKVHLGLSEHFHGHTIEIEPEIDEIVREFWPWYRQSGLDVRRSEHAIVSPLGYAGTIDYVGTYFGRPAVVDFKTQDFESEKQAMFYDEHALQLSGYAVGGDMVDHERLSVIISRTTPGLVAFHDWSVKGTGKKAYVDRNEIARWDRAWLALWEYWQHSKNYYPGKVFDIDDDIES